MKTRASLAGFLSGAVALGISELVASILAKASVVVAVGDAVIALAPRPMVEFGKNAFGTNDKPALIIGILVICAVAALALGPAAAARRRVGAIGLATFGVVGIAAAMRTPNASPFGLSVAVIIGATAGYVVLTVLLDRAGAGSAAVEAPGPDANIAAPGLQRRRFLQLAGAFTVVAVAGGGASRYLVGRARVAASRMRAMLPSVRRPVALPSVATSVGVDGVASIITTNDDFFLIDTALVAPLVDLDTWTVRITGMVDRPYTLTWADISEMDMVERYVTLACVSNEVGGDLIGNAAWRGVLLRDILERAGVQSRADQLVGRSVDGFTAGFPVEFAMDDRGAMIAVGMNGELLPIEHGFPARLIVPGLYGYVSATKWLEEIELTTFDSFDAYWIPRGWSRFAPVKTQSRIDAPRKGANVKPGPTAIAGVAWAPTRGVSKVEVRVDDGEWRTADLADALTDQTWRQWSYRWEATPGQHDIRVRATDGDGDTQGAEFLPPDPDGAEGHHAITVNVDR